jgi:hypothetical protein
MYTLVSKCKHNKIEGGKKRTPAREEKYGRRHI